MFSVEQPQLAAHLPAIKSRVFQQYQHQANPCKTAAWQDGEGEGHISLSPAPRSPLSLKVGADRAGKKLSPHDHGPTKPGKELSTTQRCVQPGGQESD